MIRILLCCSKLILSVHVIFGQLGGLNTFEFLNLPASARIAALGGNLITVRDDDANLAFANPGLLNPEMHGSIAFNHSFHLGGIQHGSFNYSFYAPKLASTFHGGIQYVSYGDFDETTASGQIIGTFDAAEYALTLGTGKEVDERLTLGANLKLITSNLAVYNSLGIAADLAAVYYDTAANLTASIVMRNIGTQLSTYRDGNREPLPFEIQVGLSKRLKYLPFRFSIIYHHADRWNILFDDPNAEEPTLFFGEELTERSKVDIWFDNFFRHFIFNGEFLFGKNENFRVRFGYNHFMRRELIVDTFGSFAGFSLGAGIKINRFRIDYGRANYHLAGGVNHLSISTNLRAFR